MQAKAEVRCGIAAALVSLALSLGNLFAWISFRFCLDWELV